MNHHPLLPSNTNLYPVWYFLPFLLLSSLVHFYYLCLLCPPFLLFYLSVSPSPFTSPLSFLSLSLFCPLFSFIYLSFCLLSPSSESLLLSFVYLCFFPFSFLFLSFSSPFSPLFSFFTLSCFLFLSVCLSSLPSLCLFVCLFVCLTVCLSLSHYPSLFPFSPLYFLKSFFPEPPELMGALILRKGCTVEHVVSWQYM